jgi:hypothetical protein
VNLIGAGSTAMASCLNLLIMGRNWYSRIEAEQNLTAGRTASTTLRKSFPRGVTLSISSKTWVSSISTLAVMKATWTPLRDRTTMATLQIKALFEIRLRQHTLIFNQGLPMKVALLKAERGSRDHYEILIETRSTFLLIDYCTTSVWSNP